MYPQLVDLGIASPINAFALTLMCQLVGVITKLQDMIAEDGLVIDGTRGRKRHPADQALDGKVVQYTRLCQEFGITPASKTRVQASPSGGQQSKAERFGF